MSISFEKPKKSSKALFYVSEGLLSLLHTERVSNNLDIKIQDASRRTALHYSSFLDLEAMSLYLRLCGLDPFLTDSSNQSSFHVLFFKGNFKTFRTLLNFELYTLNKELYEWITLLKFGISMKSVTLRNTVALYLSNTLNLSKLPTRPVESKSELKAKIDSYVKKLLDKYRLILSFQDSNRRNCLHFAAMSKFTWCFKVLSSLLEESEGFEDFAQIFSQVHPLVNPNKLGDPFKYRTALKDACDLISPDMYDQVTTDFSNKLAGLKKLAINTKDISGQTPLHIACAAGDYKIVKLLIKHGADKSIKDANGKISLDLCSTKHVMRYLNDIDEAVSKSDDKGLNHLVNSGYNVNDSKNQSLISSLHLAVLGGHMVSTVLQCQGDVNQTEWNMYTPLHYASITGRVSDLKALLTAGASINATSSHQITPLHLASRYNRSEVLKELIKEGALINSKDHHGMTPLMYASKYGSLQCAEELLKNRCLLADIDTRGWNALHYASFHSKPKLVRLLVKWDADLNVLVNVKNSQGKRPISMTSDLKTRRAFENIWNAAATGNLDLVRRLIRKKVDVNSTTVGERKTPLMMAAVGGSVLMVRLLIENGAKVDMIDNNGRAAADYVAEGSDPRIMFMIEAKSRKKPQNHARTNSF